MLELTLLKRDILLMNALAKLGLYFSTPVGFTAPKEKNLTRPQYGSLVKKWYSEKNPSSVSTISYGTWIGLGKLALGGIFGTVGAFKENIFLKRAGVALAGLGVLVAFAGKIFGFEVNGKNKHGVDDESLAVVGKVGIVSDTEEENEPKTIDFSYGRLSALGSDYINSRDNLQNGDATEEDIQKIAKAFQGDLGEALMQEIIENFTAVLSLPTGNNRENGEVEEGIKKKIIESLCEGKRVNKGIKLFLEPEYKNSISQDKLTEWRKNIKGLLLKRLFNEGETTGIKRSILCALIDSDADILSLEEYFDIGIMDLPTKSNTSENIKIALIERLKRLYKRLLPVYDKNNPSNKSLHQRFINYLIDMTMKSKSTKNVDGLVRQYPAIYGYAIEKKVELSLLSSLVENYLARMNGQEDDSITNIFAHSLPPLYLYSTKFNDGKSDMTKHLKDHVFAILKNKDSKFHDEKRKQLLSGFLPDLKQNGARPLIYTHPAFQELFYTLIDIANNTSENIDFRYHAIEKINEIYNYTNDEFILNEAKEKLCKETEPGFNNFVNSTLKSTKQVLSRIG